MKIGDVVTLRGRRYYLRGNDPLSMSEPTAQLEDCETGDPVMAPLSALMSTESDARGNEDAHMIPEASLDQTEHGLMPVGRGWFVLNARDARWFDTHGRGKEPGLQGRGDFPQLGLGLQVLEPGEPMSMYHWETDQEDFLILAGEGLLIVEGQERRLRQWDLVHCPPGTGHVIVGAGDGPCIVFAVGALEKHTIGSRVEGTLEGTEDWGAYTVDEAALRHGAGVDEETNDAGVAYARFPEPEPTRYRDGWLPG